MSGPPARKATQLGQQMSEAERLEVSPTIDYVDRCLKERRFDHAKPPPQVRATYWLVGQGIATPGNLVAISSAVKTGKSAFMGAMIACTISTDGEADLLGLSSENPNGLAVLHFDSEQSPYDHWHGIDRALRRARATECPAWLHSYCLTGLSCKDSKQYLNDAIEVAANKCGGIHSILLDGIADFVANVNDPEECNTFVAELHGIAIENHCPIVIHLNPGSDKTRGHLGSQFERKAETNLRLDKDDEEITTVWSDKQRRAPIPKKTGPCFQFDQSAGMHVTVQNPAEAKAEARAEGKQVAEAEDAGIVFAQGKKDQLRYTDLIEAMGAALNLSEPGAKRRLQNWRKNGIVVQDNEGAYRLRKP